MSIFTRSKSDVTAPADTFDAPTDRRRRHHRRLHPRPAHTRLGFSARHAMVTTVRGQFKDFTGTAARRHREPGRLQGRRSPSRPPASTPARPTATATCAPPTSSTPRATPRSPSSPPTSTRDGDDWAITGDLTIKGVTKPVTIDFESTGSAQDPFGNLRVGFEGATTINRKDWGLTWNAALETGGVLVSEKIKLEFDVSAIKNA